MRLPRIHPLCALLALASVLPYLFLSGTEPYWSDWGLEAGPVVKALLLGDVQEFLGGRNPAYAASLLLRAPLFLAVGAFGGNEDAAFHASKVLGLLMLAALGAWLLTRAHASGLKWPALLVVAFVVAGNPIVETALGFGHPEELMAAALAIAGVLLAARGRSGWAGVLVGLAIVTKQWAVLAVLPAVAAAPARRLLLLLVAGGLAVAFHVPFLLASSGFASVQHDVATNVGAIWRSHQLFWPLGVETIHADSPGPKMAPAWFGGLPRLLIVALSLPLSLLWWRRRREGRGHADDVLLLLALLLLARCALDPWNIHYYHLPFLLTLGAWEVIRRPGLPVLALVATAAVWFNFNVWPWHYGDATYALYMGWTLPLTWYLVRELLGRERAPAAVPAAATRPEPARA